MDASSLKIPTASVPQIPATRWTDRAPTGSSTYTLSKSGIARTARPEPITPIRIDNAIVG